MVSKDPEQTLGPRGQPEIAIGSESQIEPWLPFKRHHLAAKRGIRRTVLRKSTTDNDRRSPRHQLFSIARGWLSEKTLAARSGEEFSLDSPFHRTDLKQKSFNSGMMMALPRLFQRPIR